MSTEEVISSARDASTVVADMLDAVADRRIDAAIAALTDDIEWHNVSMPKIRGIKRVSKVMNVLSKPTWGFEVTMHNIASHGDVVLTERTDVLRWRLWRIEFWVCGTFELRNGKIAVWRDHFDYGNFLRGAVVGALRAL
ncbi:MAG: limonene-1,2-epoxide hydrolase family protein, partial [Rhodococcus sp. (in: high G+C Gram-positive bacteria)]